MFEKIVLRRSPTGGALTAGEIAEALLFYDNVHVLLDFGSLGGLLRTIGPDLLCSLIEENRLKASYYRNLLGTYSETKNYIQTHRFEVFEWSGDAKSGPKKRIEDTLPLIFKRALDDPRLSRKSAERFLKSVPTKSFSEGFGHPKGIRGVATADLDDAGYIRQVVEIAIRTRLPSYVFPPGWDFQIMRLEDDFFIVSTNLPYNELNKQYQRLYRRDDKPFNSGHLIDHVLDARADLMLSVDNMAEFMTSQVSGSIMELKVKNILYRRYRNAGEIDLFQKIIIPNSRNLKEAIDSGDRKFEEFLPVLDKANKFKSWLRKGHPDSNVVSEYLMAVKEKTWIDKLPTKGLRFVATTAVGLAEPAAGVTLGLADAFLLDRFAKGWRPNQFIENYLQPFVSNQTN
ncbi:MAG: hypothetical protein ACFCUW_11800 [Kiloniellaceae bacterium]